MEEMAHNKKQILGVHAGICKASRNLRHRILNKV